MKLDPEVRVIVETELQLHPQGRMQDLCKALFQAWYGPGHMAPTEEIARRWLWHEMGGELNTTEVMWQQLGAKYGRLNLGPWKARKLPVEPLLQAFLVSADLPVNRRLASWPGDWRQIEEQLLTEGYARLDDETLPVTRSLDAKSLLIHHSEVYHTFYNPHYRVIATDEWNKLKQQYDIGGTQ